MDGRPGDLDLWQFDGWSENGLGGIYFYGDWHAETPWGATRPDYGRKEVRQFIRDNALMWLEEYHVDGLRLDMTLSVAGYAAITAEQRLERLQPCFWQPGLLRCGRRNGTKRPTARHERCAARWLPRRGNDQYRAVQRASFFPRHMC